MDYLRHCIVSGQNEEDILQQMSPQEIQDLDLAIDELRNYVQREMEKREILSKHQS
jgi:HAMP domain-containing protein